MSKEILQYINRIREALSDVVYEKREIKGKLVVTSENLPVLQILARADIIEHQLIMVDKTVIINQLQLVDGQEFGAPITIYTNRITNADYFENIAEIIRLTKNLTPTTIYYVHSFKWYSDEPPPTKIQELADVREFSELLQTLADYREEEMGSSLKLIFFSKRKLALRINYNENLIRAIKFLPELKQHFTLAHDKAERKEIFIAELVSTLADKDEEERFSNLLMNLDAFYEGYIKSHSVYLEKFSYHDLKLQIDSDKLEYTKKIYGAVNEVQSKIVAVPAAFLLVLSQFDYSGQGFTKNFFISAGAVLFAGIIEILISNQFGLVTYIEKELNLVTDKLKKKKIHVVEEEDIKSNSDNIDNTPQYQDNHTKPLTYIEEFIRSFGELDKVIFKQRKFLAFFRIITWAVPIMAVIMLFIYKK